MRFPSHPDSLEEQNQVDITKFSKVEELEGKLKMDLVDEKLMHSILENDKNVIDEGLVIEESLNRGMGAFTPNLFFENLVKSYSMAKKMFGEALIRAVSGYDPDYIEKNIGIPEFQRELKKRIEKKLEQFKKDRVLAKDGTITEKGMELASIVLYTQELDNIIPKGLYGERLHKRTSVYGTREDVHPFRKSDRYKDVAIKRSAKTAIVRGHSQIELSDLKAFERQSKGSVYLVYALDSSGSMKGDKISVCKKAGVALAYKAIRERDKVGLIVFGTDVKETIEPTMDFTRILKAISSVRASAETDMAGMIKKAAELFPSINATKHLLILSDALPTKGDDPEKAALEAASAANARGITISLIGINLDTKGKKLAEKLTRIGRGKLYSVRDLKEIDRIVLEDYYSLK